MKKIPRFLYCLLCTATMLSAEQGSTDILVGGDVPRPGPVAYQGKGLTLEAAIAMAGMDLKPFYPDPAKDAAEKPCPIQVVVHRDGAKYTYDPRRDSVKLQTEPSSPHDVIEIKDLSKLPLKIAAKSEQLDRAISLGSTEVGDRISELAGLQYEFALFQAKGDKAEPDSLDSILKKEAARLSQEGKREKIIGLLELRRDSLESDGLGPTHPVLIKNAALIKIFTAQPK